MSAPSRPPTFCDAIGGTTDPLDRAAGWLIDDIARMPKYFPDWFVDNETPIPVSLTLMEHEAETRAVLTWNAGSATGTLTATRDPVGWLVLAAEHEGVEVFRGYIERIYEEYEVWPPGSDGEGVESPGRIGKKKSWTSLVASAWPLLSPIAENGWVNIRIDDQKLSARMDRERGQTKHFTSSDGVTLVYDDVGPHDGTPIVICHGLAAAGEQMSADAAYFAGLGYRVLVPDLRGHGRSGKPAPLTRESLSIDRIAADLVAMLDDAGVAPVHWVGNSLGGIAALAMLAQDEHRFRTLTTFGTAFRLGLPRWGGLIPLGYAVFGKRLIAALTAVGTTKNWRARVLIEKFIRQNDPQVGGVLASNLATYDLTANAQRATLPMLMLRGGHDGAVNLALGASIAAMKGRENFTLVEIPEGGHCANLDATDAWRAALLAFWKDR